jgi:hypothetical protein
MKLLMNYSADSLAEPTSKPWDNKWKSHFRREWKILSSVQQAAISSPSLKT